MRIGIHVGATNTDAVIMDGMRVMASCKRPTTADVSGGIVAALQEVLAETALPASAITAVMLGTTHFTNAVQVVDLEEVPLSYLPGNAARIRVKVVGDLVVA